MNDDGSLPPAEFTGESFLGRPFDAYQNIMQIARAIREASRQRGCERPAVLELSRRPTQIEEFLPEARVTHYPTHDADEEPALEAPLRLPFDDGAFDALLVTDAYEHLPQDVRPALLGEMVRVTKGVVLLGAPMRGPLVDRFDRLIFDFIWSRTGGYVMKPIQQHIRYGHEPVEDVIAALRASGAHGVVALPCNYIYRWLPMLLAYFDLQDGNPAGEIYEPLNRIYNERLSPYDYREPSYRHLLVVATDPALDLAAFEAVMASPPEPPASMKEAEGALLDTWQIVRTREGEEMRRFRDERDAARADANRALAANDTLRAEVAARPAPEVVAELQGEVEELRARVTRAEAERAGATAETARVASERDRARGALDAIRRRGVLARVRAVFRP